MKGAGDRREAGRGPESTGQRRTLLTTAYLDMNMTATRMKIATDTTCSP